MSQWNDIRTWLRANESGAALDAAIAVGKVRRGKLPQDIADAMLGLFSHPDAQVRQEAVRSLGVHWRLLRAVDAITEILSRSRDEDELVQLSAIGALAAIGLEHAVAKCSVSKTLAGVVLNESIGDYQRMVAYVELLRLEGRIDFDEYARRDRDIPESIDRFEIDWSWIEELAIRDCSSSSSVPDR